VGIALDVLGRESHEVDGLRLVAFYESEQWSVATSSALVVVCIARTYYRDHRALCVVCLLGSHDTVDYFVVSTVAADRNNKRALVLFGHSERNLLGVAGMRRLEEMNSETGFFCGSLELLGFFGSVIGAIGVVNSDDTVKLGHGSRLSVANI